MAAQQEPGDGSRRQVLVGLGVAGFGLFLAGLAAGLVPAADSSFHVPRWVIGCIGVGGLLIGGGLALRMRAQRWTAAAALAGIALAFLVPALWIAFGPGVRECASGFSFGLLGGRVRSGGFDCRAAFALGALLVLAILVAGLGAFVHLLWPESPWASRLEKGGGGFTALLLAGVLAVGLIVASPLLIARWLWRRAYARPADGSGGSEA
jgi:hypothetical protein